MGLSFLHILWHACEVCRTALHPTMSYGTIWEV